VFLSPLFSLLQNNFLNFKINGSPVNVYFARVQEKWKNWKLSSILWLKIRFLICSVLLSFTIHQEIGVKLHHQSLSSPSFKFSYVLQQKLFRYLLFVGNCLFCYIHFSFLFVDNKIFWILILFGEPRKNFTQGQKSESILRLLAGSFSLAIKRAISSKFIDSSRANSS
jgi:hypothetical protein